MVGGWAHYNMLANRTVGWFRGGIRGEGGCKDSRYEQQVGSIEPMACCKCCKMEQKKLLVWVCLVFLTGLLFMGASIWAMGVAGGDVRDNLSCIVDAVKALLRTCEPPVNPNLKEGCSAAAAVPKDTVDKLSDAVDLLGPLAAAPGSICFCFLFLISLMVLCAQKAKACFCISKVTRRALCAAGLPPPILLSPPTPLPLPHRSLPERSCLFSSPTCCSSSASSSSSSSPSSA